MAFHSRLHAIAPIVGSHLFSVSCQAIVMLSFHFNLVGLGCCVCCKCVSYSVKLMPPTFMCQSLSSWVRQRMSILYSTIVWHLAIVSCPENSNSFLHTTHLAFTQDSSPVSEDFASCCCGCRQEGTGSQTRVGAALGTLWTIKQPSLLKIFMTQKYLWQICLQTYFCKWILLEVIQ